MGGYLNSQASRQHETRIVKSRQISFFVEQDLLSKVMGAIVNDVLPRFAQLPHFLDFVALQSENGPRKEIAAMSFWDDGLEGSESVSREFRSEIQRAVGTNPSRKAYDILRVVVRDTDGQPCLDV
jgi:hypothetical protein